MASVLVGESVADIRGVLIRLFERSGYEVRSADDADGCLRAVAGQRPDLVLLNLPNDDAVRVCRHLRADPDTRDIAVIMLSADAHPNAQDADRAGADAYVSKPFANADLLAQAAALFNA